MSYSNRSFLYKPVLFLLFTVLIQAQTAWEILNPLPQEKTINAVQIIKDSLVYAAGENGAFLHSSDYGNTWLKKPQGVEKSFMSVYFTNEMTGWLGERGGKLYRTTDGGYNFSLVQTFSGRDIIRIFMAGNSGYICTREGELIKTNDAFVNHTRHTISTTEIISDISLKQDGTGLAAGELGGIYSTSDYGVNWQKANFTAPSPLYGLLYYNNKQIIYGYNGYLAISSDNGSSWNGLSVGNANIKSVSASVSGKLFAANVKGEIYLSSDSGASWQISLAGDDAVYRTVASSGSFVFAAGENGIMAATKNDGANWYYSSTGSRVRFNKIRFVDENYGFIIGDKGLLLVTSDGGNTWERRNTGTTRELFDFHLNKNNQGHIGLWLVGANGTHLLSSDTGRSFSVGPVATLVSYNLRTIHMSYNVSRIAGDGGVSYEALNRWGSSGWRKAGTYSPNINFLDFWATTGSIGFLVGSGGTIIRYYYYFQAVAQENISWETPYELRSVYFTDVKFGWIVGENGVVLGTSDGGHFALRTNLPVSYLNSVHFINRETGFTVGTNGKIFKSTNYGLDWRELPSGVTYTLNCVYMVNENKIYIVGANGLLMKSESSGELPTAIKKEGQSDSEPAVSVYPNPVTKSDGTAGLTFFEVYLPKPSSYSLVLYNSLGELIGEIDSDEKPAGKHIVNFEPPSFNLSSGTYIALLKTPFGCSKVKLLYLK